MPKYEIAKYFFLALLVSFILAPKSPWYHEIPNRDSGVFLYIGQQILDGKIPYRDLWDHKGPLIYLINAFGLFLSHGSIWGVWFLQTLSLYLAGLLCITLLNEAFGRTPAIFGTISWLLSYSTLIGTGNSSEEYALPLQFAAIILFWRMQKSRSWFKCSFLIGTTLALSILLRPNIVGVHLSIVLFLLSLSAKSIDRHKILASILGIATGSLTIFLPVCFYLALKNALIGFYDQVIRYNILYTTKVSGNRLSSFLYGLIVMPQGVTILAFASCLIGIIYTLRRKGTDQEVSPLIYLGMIALPIEFLLSSASGRGYEHYFISWLPIYAVLNGFFIYGITRNLSSSKKIRKQKKVIINLSIVFLLFLVNAGAITKITSELMSLLHTDQSEKSQSHEIISYIQKKLGSEDSLLMWGAESTYNFLTNREAPSRYFYQYPLYTPGYQHVDMIEELINDIDDKKPLIIDTSPTNLIIPPIDTHQRQKWMVIMHYPKYRDYWSLLPEMCEIFDYLDSHYELIHVFDQSEWLVYQYKSGQ